MACGKDMLLLRSHNSSLLKIAAILSELPADQLDQHVLSTTLRIVNDDDKALRQILFKKLDSANSIQRHILVAVGRRTIHEHKVIERRRIKVFAAIVRNAMSIYSLRHKGRNLHPMLHLALNPGGPLRIMLHRGNDRLPLQAIIKLTHQDAGLSRSHLKDTAHRQFCKAPRNQIQQAVVRRRSNRVIQILQPEPGQVPQKQFSINDLHRRPGRVRGPHQRVRDSESLIDFLPKTHINTTWIELKRSPENSPRDSQLRLTAWGTPSHFINKYATRMT